MVNSSKNCSIKWLEPSPLWGEHGRWIRLPEQTQAATPLILRFANDNFMEELLAMLDQCPWRLSEWEAQPETWREPMPSPNPIYKTRPNPSHENLYNGSKLILNKPISANINGLTPGIDLSRAEKGLSRDESPIKLYQAAQNGSKLILNKPISANINGLTPGIDLSRAPKGPSRDESPIKLYQAAQNRHYLVTASLISEEKGYPDYNLDLSNNERATFVIRALVPTQDKTSTDEYAFVTTPGGKAWKKVAPYIDPYEQTLKLIQGEEQLPLFPMNYPDRCGRHRQILGGLIPVGKREEWLAASEWGDETHTGMINPVSSTEGGVHHLKEIFYADVVEPWRALIDQAQYLKASLTTDKNTFPNFSGDGSETNAFNDKTRALKTVRDQIQTGSWYILLDFANFIDKNLPNVWQSITHTKASPDISEGEQSFIKLLANTTLSAECFVTLAIENLIVAKNSIEKVTLWEELKAVWELEDALQFSNWPNVIEGIPSSVIDRIEGEEFDSYSRQLFNRILTIIQTETGFTLMDLVVYLNTNVPNLKKLALNEITESSLTDDEQKAKDRLEDMNKTDIDAMLSVIGVDDLSHDRITIKYSLLEALVAVKAYDKALEKISFQYDRSKPPVDESKSPVIDPLWPRFLFPLADPDTNLEMNRSAVIPSVTIDSTGLKEVELLVAKLNAMADLIDTLVPKPDIAPERETERNFQPLLNQREARFVIHCVFERPNCGPLFPPLVSKPSRQLEMAPFFDPDAPARAVRIPLPMDISPAGLRKYKKNAIFLISDMLCGKIKKIKKLTLGDLVLSVLPWPFHKDLPKVGPAGPCKSPDDTIGMLCSVSIPIVTLCALILMIIMVQLFDIFFRWIPYLFVCLPIPSFKGKEDDGT